MDCAGAQAVICRDNYLVTQNARVSGRHEVRLDIYQSVFELIDMRSFSNLWFWIVLAVMWSSASHWVLGVPYDIIQRANRQINQHDMDGMPAVQDLEDLVRINTNRLSSVSDMSGAWMMSFIFFVLTSLFLLGFFYKIEFSQALFLLLFPLSIVISLSVRRALKIRRENLGGIELIMHLGQLRFITQLIGMFSILVTSMWGMYQNASAMVLGI